jgi:osmotically-inducible protein OsmY
VNTSFESNQAERVAETVKGALYVVNSLEYDYQWTWKPDPEIREDIQDQLMWSPFVDEDDVNVEVDYGVATLSGRVDTWGEREAAEDNAYQGGAKDVRNELLVAYEYYGPFYRPEPMIPRAW